MRPQWPVGGSHDPDRGLTGDTGPGQAGGAEPMRGQQNADASAHHRAGQVDPQQGAKVHLALKRRHDGRAQGHDGEADEQDQRRLAHLLAVEPGDQRARGEQDEPERPGHHAGGEQGRADVVRLELGQLDQVAADSHLADHVGEADDGVGDGEGTERLRRDQPGDDQPRAQLDHEGGVLLQEGERQGAPDTGHAAASTLGRPAARSAARKAAATSSCMRSVMPANSGSRMQPSRARSDSGSGNRIGRSAWAGSRWAHMMPRRVATPASSIACITATLIERRSAAGRSSSASSTGPRPARPARRRPATAASRPA